MKILKRIWYWLNATFGPHTYHKGDDSKVYIKEGFNPPEELFSHLEKHHLKEGRQPMLKQATIEIDIPEGKYCGECDALVLKGDASYQCMALGYKKLRFNKAVGDVTKHADCPGNTE